MNRAKENILIALVGDSGAGHRQQAAQEALEHCSGSMGFQIEAAWLETESLAAAAHESKLGAFNGIWIVPGSPYKSLDGVLEAIRYAREERIPLLGTCAGFQHLVLEYVRNVVGHNNAVHAEYDAAASDQAISRLSCSLVGLKQTVTFEPDSLVGRTYGRRSSEEEFRCNYGLNPAYLESLCSNGMRIVGWDERRETRAVELTDHPFFVGTLFIPQYSSTAQAPHPLVCGFVKTAAESRITLPHQ